MLFSTWLKPSTFSPRCPLNQLRVRRLCPVRFGSNLSFRMQPKSNQSSAAGGTYPAHVRTNVTARVWRLAEGEWFFPGRRPGGILRYLSFVPWSERCAPLSRPDTPIFIQIEHVGMVTTMSELTAQATRVFHFQADIMRISSLKQIKIIHFLGVLKLPEKLGKTKKHPINLLTPR